MLGGSIDRECRLVAADGREVVLPVDMKEIYIACVVRDHFRALRFQVWQFLKTESIDAAQAPLVMDVFAVDATIEMPQFPRQFLRCANRRANDAAQLMASQELAILGDHLTKNPWAQP